MVIEEGSVTGALTGNPGKPIGQPPRTPATMDEILKRGEALIKDRVQQGVKFAQEYVSNARAHLEQQAKSQLQEWSNMARDAVQQGVDRLADQVRDKLDDLEGQVRDKLDDLEGQVRSKLEAQIAKLHPKAIKTPSVTATKVTEAIALFNQVGQPQHIATLQRLVAPLDALTAHVDVESLTAEAFCPTALGEPLPVDLALPCGLRKVESSGGGALCAKTANCQTVMCCATQIRLEGLSRLTFELDDTPAIPAIIVTVNGARLHTFSVSTPYTLGSQQEVVTLPDSAGVVVLQGQVMTQPSVGQVDSGRPAGVRLTALYYPCPDQTCEPLPLMVGELLQPADMCQAHPGTSGACILRPGLGGRPATVEAAGDATTAAYNAATTTLGELMDMVGDASGMTAVLTAVQEAYVMLRPNLMNSALAMIPESPVPDICHGGSFRLPHQSTKIVPDVLIPIPLVFINLYFGFGVAGARSASFKVEACFISLRAVATVTPNFSGEAYGWWNSGGEGGGGGGVGFFFFFFFFFFSFFFFFLNVRGEEVVGGTL